MDVALVRNIVQANRLIERNDAAIGFAEKATKEAAFASDAGLWSAFADALNKAGRQDEAFAALDKAQSIDANYAVNARRASWKLDAGDVAGAEPAIRAGVQKGEITAQQADALAQKIAVTAFQKKGQTGQHQAALRDYAVAEEFASSPLGKAYIAFFKGYSVLQIAVEREKPENLATAQATLPMFKEVLALMSAAAGVPANLQANRQEMIDAANQYVAIQEAIIKRGR
jgi:tetratricopeptide (TPR) repeat protein